MLYSIDYINLITERSDNYQIDGLNYICSSMLGGTGGHTYDIDALNEICTLQGVASGHKYNIDALNAICSGSYQYEDEAWLYIQSSSVLNPFPVPSLQSFASDLTVIDKSGNKYFKATKGDDLLITNCDFTGKGWPVKSIATIDIFGQVGVPVISLFSGNFDYLNQYFTKSVAATYDANGVELTPLYISAIVAYSAPLTGADLTAANSYFAPDAASTYHLDPVSGNNANNATTKALARKTVTSVESLITTGGVNIYSGAITDTSLLLSKVIDWIGKGKTIFKTPATSDGVIRAGNTTNKRTFTGLIIDAQNANSFVGYFGQMTNLEFYKCLFINPKLAEYAFNALSASASSGVKLNKCIINVASQYGSLSVGIAELNDSLIKGSSVYDFWKPTVLMAFNNNKSLITTAAGKAYLQATAGIQAIGGKIVNAGKGQILIDGATATQTKFNNQTIEQVDIDGGSNNYIVVKGTNSEFKNNNITLTGVSAAGNDNKNYIVNVFGSTTPDASGNTIDYAAAGFYAALQVLSNNVNCGAAKFNNNRIICRTAVNSSMLVLDGEKAAAQHHLFDGAEMSNNVCYAPGYYSNGFGTMHGIMAWASNVSMLRNYVNGAWIGMLMKGQDTTVTAVLSGKFINCGISIMLKGVSGAEISGAYVDSNNADGSANAIDIIKNGAYKNNNSKVNNSTLIYRGTTASYRLLYFDDADCLTGLVSDYNTFYSTNAAIVQVGATAYTFAEWQALGYDTHSVLLTVAPAFDETEL